MTARAVRRRWWQALAESPARWLAAPLWCAYRPLIGLRNAAYDGGIARAYDLGAPTISIGNLTVGGTGKTPLVALVCALLRARGRDPAVLSRGYGAAAGEANDEARMLALPAFCHPDRRVSAARARAAGHDCLVLDDGFQHRRARRDLDLVLVDATRPWGEPGRTAAVLPLGLLREPRSSLARADALILTRADLVDDAALAALRATLARAGRPVWTARQRATALIGLADGVEAAPPVLSGHRVLLASGIGNPAGFERLAATLGWDVAESLRFPDHHAYSAEDARTIVAAATAARAAIVVTDKDAVKLRPLVAASPGLAAARALRVAVELDAADGAALESALDAALARRGR